MQSNEEAVTLFHVTREDLVECIRAEGLKAGSYLCNSEELVAYYREVVEDEGGAPVTLAVRLSDVPVGSLAVDRPSISEPITSALRMSEDEIAARWANCDGDWRDCLDIVGSVCVVDRIPPESIALVLGGEVVRLALPRSVSEGPGVLGRNFAL